MLKIIGISGVSGSGKTTLAHSLGKALNATTIFWDDYDPISEGPSNYVKWFETSKDSNDWEYDALAEVLRSLKQSKELICPATQRKLIPTEYIIFNARLTIASFKCIEHLEKEISKINPKTKEVKYDTSMGSRANH